MGLGKGRFKDRLRLLSRWKQEEPYVKHDCRQENANGPPRDWGGRSTPSTKKLLGCVRRETHWVETDNKILCNTHIFCALTKQSLRGRGSKPAWALRIKADCLRRSQESGAVKRVGVRPNLAGVSDIKKLRPAVSRLLLTVSEKRSMGRMTPRGATTEMTPTKCG